MRRLLGLTLLPALLLAGCAQEPPSALPEGRCEVKGSNALCDGSWASLKGLQRPEKVTQIGMTAPADEQPDLKEFPKLTSVVLDSAPLDIRRLPDTVKTVAVLGNHPVIADQNRTLKRFYLVRDASAVDLFAVQPAKHITGRLKGSSINLDKLEQSQALKIEIDINDPDSPSAVMNGRTTKLGNGKFQRVIDDAFPYAPISELRLTRTAAR